MHISESIFSPANVNIVLEHVSKRNETLICGYEDICEECRKLGVFNIYLFLFFEVTCEIMKNKLL